ncbi:MAG: shikimate dehydrogenase family protein [Flavobacteriales bacterium]
MSDSDNIQRYGLIGYPLVHSFSKGYFTSRFESMGRADCRYENYALASIEAFPELLQSAQNLRGLNVTIPYKESVIPYLDELDKEARAIGAVNCIRIRSGKTTGYNTDVHGFEMSIKPFLENRYERALILGTGGASKAVAYVLERWGIPFHFVSRTPQGERQMGYDVLKAEVMHHFPLIINTTPVGTYPNIDACPYLPYEGLSERHFLYDLIYNPEETTFLRLGRLSGAKTMNGHAMLLLQADRSWQIWNEEI